MNLRLTLHTGLVDTPDCVDVARLSQGSRPIRGYVGEAQRPPGFHQILEGLMYMIDVVILLPLGEIMIFTTMGVLTVVHHLVEGIVQFLLLTLTDLDVNVIFPGHAHDLDRGPKTSPRLSPKSLINMDLKRSIPRPRSLVKLRRNPSLREKVPRTPVLHLLMMIHLKIHHLMINLPLLRQTMIERQMKNIILENRQNKKYLILNRWIT